MNRKINIFLIIAMMLVVVLQHCYYDSKSHNVKVVTHTRVDTTYKTCIVTIRDVKYKVIRDSIIDTFRVKSDSGSVFSIPISQKYYKSEACELWISGYNPKLDSLNVFQKEKYITIYKEKESVSYRTKTAFYVNGGFTMIGNEAMPHVGMTFTTPKRLMLGANIGEFNKKITYSLNIGYKL